MRPAHVLPSLYVICLLLTSNACLGTYGNNSAAASGADSGTVTLHRLNHVEYNNSVHDLLGTKQTPADQLSADPVAGGFDNNADALNIGANDMQVYENAAESLAAEACDPNNSGFTQLVACGDPNAPACVQKFVQTFGQRAWRRPLTQQEVIAVTQASQTASATDLHTQVAAAMTVLLSSPYFIFRVELDANPASTQSHPLSGYELAARLSYFLWSSTPDDALLQAAADGSILTDAGITDQVTRMLADPRANALSQNLAGQWWELRQSQTLTPDPNMFPKWNAKLQADSIAQSQEFFTDMVKGTTSLTSLFTADHVYLNDDLAAFYGLPPVDSNTLKSVPLPEGPRRGLLGQAAVLSATSFPIRTSPVRRGEFILGQLLCTPPQPPPANVPQLPGASTNAPTQRQQLDAHASNPACASCHNVMDPYGFALESFDAIGASRTTDNGAPINTAATLPSGQAVAGPQDLATALSQDPRVPSCATQMFYVYALGRSITSGDAGPLGTLTSTFVNQGQHLNQLIEQIALSQPFRMRRGGS